MATFSEIYGKDVTEEKLAVYAMLLADLPLVDLERALQLAAKTCTTFPTIADIRKLIIKQFETQDQFEADKAWEGVQQILRRHWFGELLPIMGGKKPENWTGRIEQCNGGFLLHAPALDAATDYAVRLVGGLDRIANAAGDKELDFIRRDFLGAYRRHRETVGLIAPSRAAAKQFLEKLHMKQLGEAK